MMMMMMMMMMIMAAIGLRLGLGLGASTFSSHPSIIQNLQDNLERGKDLLLLCGNHLSFAD